MSKSQVRCVVIIVYLSFFIMSQFSTKNRASKIDLRSLIFFFSNKLDKISREAVSCRTAQNVPTFFSKNFVLRCPEMYITQTLPNQNSDDGQRRQLPFPMRCYFLFPIPHWHTIVFFCYQRSKKKTCLGQQYNHESCRSSVTRNKRRRGYEPCLVRKQGGRRREKVTVWGHNNVFSSLTPFLHRLLARFSRSSRLDKKLQFWSTFRLSRSIEKNWSLLKLKPRP